MKTKIQKLKSVKIGPWVTPITWVSDLNNNNLPALGTYSYLPSRIEINTKVEDVQQQVEVILHECLHGLLGLTGSTNLVEQGEKEEALVSFLGLHLTQLLLDNPKLVEAIYDESKRRKHGSK